MTLFKYYQHHEQPAVPEQQQVVKAEPEKVAGPNLA